MYLKGDKGKVNSWCCVLCKNDFKGRNGKKAKIHYGISVTGYDIKSCVVTVPPEMRCQLKKILTKNK